MVTKLTSTVSLVIINRVLLEKRRRSEKLPHAGATQNEYTSIRPHITQCHHVLRKVCHLINSEAKFGLIFQSKCSKVVSENCKFAK
jgi:hypothetical protein